MLTPREFDLTTFPDSDRYEELASYLLDQIAPRLPSAGLAWIELSVSQTPGVSALVRMESR